MMIASSTTHWQQTVEEKEGKGSDQEKEEEEEEENNSNEDREEDEEEEEKEEKEEVLEDEPYYEYARRYDINIKKKPHRRPIQRQPQSPPRLIPHYSQLRLRPDNDSLGLIFSYLSPHYFGDIRRVNRQWYRVATTRSAAAAATASRKSTFDAQLAFRQLLKQEFQLSPINPHRLSKKVVSLSFHQHHPLLDLLCAKQYPDLTSLSYTSRHSYGNMEVTHSEEYHLSHAGTLSNQLLTLILHSHGYSCGHFPPLHSFHQLRVLLINSSPGYPDTYPDFASSLSQLHSLECLKLARGLGDTKTCAVLRYLSSEHSLRILDIECEEESLKPIYTRTRTKSIKSEKKQDGNEKEEEEEEVMKQLLSAYIDGTSTQLLPHSRLTSLTLHISRFASWTRASSEQIFVNLPHLRHFGCFVDVEMWYYKTESIVGTISTKNTDQIESMQINIEHLVDQQRLGLFTNLRRLQLNLYSSTPQTVCLTWMQSLQYLQELTIWTYYPEIFNDRRSFVSLASLLSLERLSLDMTLTIDQLDVIAASLSQLSHFIILRVLEWKVQNHLSSSFLISMSQSLLWRQVRLDSTSISGSALFPQQGDNFRDLTSTIFLSTSMQQIRIRRYCYSTCPGRIKLGKKLEIDVFRLVEKTKVKGRYRWKFVPEEQ